VTDEELLHGLRSRNPAALEALADAYTLPVYALVHRVLAGAGTAQDVEECTGDVLYLAWERAGRFDPGRAPLRTWLLMLAKYQALDLRRRLLRQAGQPLAANPDPNPDTLTQPEAALAAREEREAVQQALDQLPPVEKELVYRRYFLNERVDAAAEALGLTRQAADNRLWRARKTLKGLLNWWQKGEVAGDER
jgi:RNA polymerase sigma-70 factor (ECF subfamily)